MTGPSIAPASFGRLQYAIVVYVCCCSFCCCPITSIVPQPATRVAARAWRRGRWRRRWRRWRGWRRCTNGRLHVATSHHDEH